jgi:integrase/recombinase XerD
MTAALVKASPEHALPQLITGAGKRATWRFLEFFTVNIRNRNTRGTYVLAAGAFLRWCEDKGIRRIDDVQPVHVAGYIEELGQVRKAPTVKQHLACLRMLFDWGQVVPSNPAHAVRGPRHSVTKGATTVMSSGDASAFLKGIDTSHVVGLRDRAFIGVMVYAFARVSAVVGLKVEDYFPMRKRWWLRLNEKNGKVNEMGCHHKLEQFLDEYIAAAGLADDPKGPLFRAAIGRTGKLSARPMSRVDGWYMVRRRARDAGIDAAIGNHSFRAIGLTDYLENGGEINIAKRMAGHSNIRTTELYDRRGDEVSFSEIELYVAKTPIASLKQRSPRNSNGGDLPNENVMPVAHRDSGSRAVSRAACLCLIHRECDRSDSTGDNPVPDA